MLASGEGDPRHLADQPRPAGGLPAVAAPVRLGRRRAARGQPRREPGHTPAAAPALRGGGHRRLVGLLHAVAADDRAGRVPGQHRLRPRPVRAPGARSASGRSAGCSWSPPRPGSTWPRTTPPASSPAWCSASPRRWPRSGCSPRTPSTRCATAAAGPAHLDVSGDRGDAIVRALQDQLGVLATDVAAVRPGRVRRLDAAEDHGEGRQRRRREDERAASSASSTRPRTCAPTAGTSSGGRCCTAGSRTRSRSTACGGWCSTRTTSCGCSPTPGCRCRTRSASWRSPPSASTCWSPSSSPARRRSATPRSTTRSSTRGCSIVRRMWEIGMAHRDIKPANLLVRDGTLFLIDSAFAEVRPSPWRQAVDLANMMLVLALRTDAERVYRRARLQFSDEEIAEAFAATRGLTMPSQLRRMLRQQGRDLHARLPAPAPLPAAPGAHPADGPGGGSGLIARHARRRRRRRPSIIHQPARVPAVRRRPQAGGGAAGGSAPLLLCRLRPAVALRAASWSPARRATTGRRPTASSSWPSRCRRASWVPCLEGMPLGWHFVRHGRRRAARPASGWTPTATAMRAIEVRLTAVLRHRRQRPRSPATGPSMRRLERVSQVQPAVRRARATTCSTAAASPWSSGSSGENRAEPLAVATQGLGAVAARRPPGRWSARRAAAGSSSTRRGGGRR